MPLVSADLRPGRLSAPMMLLNHDGRFDNFREFRRTSEVGVAGIKPESN